MTVLIVNTNIDFFKSIHKNLKFEAATLNTSTFKCGPKTFDKIRNEVRAKGLNPYALMNWYL
jgi:hypothetical protein